MIRLPPLPITQSQAAEADDHTRLHELVHRELSSNRRGSLCHEFRELLSPYLITDLPSDQFLHIHRAASPHPIRSDLKHSMGIDNFMDFLALEGPVLRDHYLSFKSRGHTGCVFVAEEATSRLNRRVSDCAALRITGNGIHHYTVVVVDGRDYFADFTVDQFIAYPEIVERHRMYSTLRKVDPPPSYAGALIMPIKMISPAGACLARAYK